MKQAQVTLPDMNLTPELAQPPAARSIIVACGTSYYAGLVGKFMIESLARLPVEVEYASEFRYYDPIIDENTAVLAITQSGETADTLAAMEQARRTGRHPLVHRQRHRQPVDAHLRWLHPHAGRAGNRRCQHQSVHHSRSWISTCWPATWATCAAR